MRLQYLKSILERVLPLVHVKVEATVINGHQFAKISDFEDLKMAVSILDPFGLFQREVGFLSTSPIIEFTNVNSFTTDWSIGVNIQNYTEAIWQKISDFLELIKDSVPETDENSVFIKIGAVRDLKDLAREANNFNKIFEQLILDPEINGTIEINSVDNGSIWIEVSLGITKAVAIIGAVSYSAALLFREYQNGLIMAETRRAKKITNDRLQKLNQAHDTLIDELVENEAEKIESEFFSANSNERLERIKNTIRLISDEYKKGAEIQASLKAPKEIQNNFPDMKNLLTLLPRTKELGEGKS